MAGVCAYGVYVPLWRMPRKVMGAAAGGERAVSGFDEDSLTMAVAAAANCLSGIDREEIDGLFFASTTFPYKEKPAAATAATALDLRRDVFTSDFANSLRAGISALSSAADAVNSGVARMVLVVAADCRLGAPGSDWEWVCGDGAAAFLVGRTDILAEMTHRYAVCDEIIDVWRSSEDRFIRAWESRFINTAGSLPVTRETLAGLMKRGDLAPAAVAKAVLPLSDERNRTRLARELGLDPVGQLQESFLDSLGFCGTAHPLILLAAALEEAGEGEIILVAGYGNGGEAVGFKTNGSPRSSRRSVRDCVEKKETLTEYLTYLRWRGLLPEERPPHNIGEIAPPAVWREREANIRFLGARCGHCGRVQHPPQEVCINCRKKGPFEPVRLSDRKGRLFTYSVDFQTWTPDQPIITGIVNLDGGCRVQCLVSDHSHEKLELDLPVEMSFRVLDVRSGIHNYTWKCIPNRD
ncbi:MAG: zinc ribbon domain-containing protein [Thermodesulfobacteriota bacterium]